MSQAKFEIFKSAEDNQFYFRLKADNNEIVLNGESYKRKDSCLDGIAAVKRYAGDPHRYERNDKVQNYTFNLVARNGEIIGRSESYTTAVARDAGIQVIMKIASKAVIKD